MEIETDEPIPTASQQALSGSNTGHLTVDFDSEDANYRAQVDELVRTIESMPFVSKLSQLGAPRPGFQSSLMCYAARGYKSCGCKQGKVVQLTQQRTTLLACLQDLLQQLQASRICTGSRRMNLVSCLRSGSLNKMLMHRFQRNQ